MLLPWLYLIIAGLLEICWAVGLKYTDGFSKWQPSLFTVTALIISMFLLAKAAQTLPIGTAYAVWVGIVHWGLQSWEYCCFRNIYLSSDCYTLY